MSQKSAWHLNSPQNWNAPGGATLALPAAVEQAALDDARRNPQHRLFHSGAPGAGGWGF